jgi:UDP-glucose 4-epimerase
MTSDPYKVSGGSGTPANVLVCGGAGYIGSHAVRALQADGHRVVVLDNLSTGHREAVPDDVLLVVGQVGDADLVRRTLREHDVNAVMHLCAFAYVGESMVDPHKYYRNNIGEGLGLLEAMLTEGVGRLVFSSSCTVYGVPEIVPIDETCPTKSISPYGRTKRMFEQMLVDYETAYGLRWVSLRYFNAAGAARDGSLGEDHDPETHLIPLVLRQALAREFPDMIGNVSPLHIYGDDYPTPDGTCVRDYVHVEDLADAHVRALHRLADDGDSLIANLGTGRGTSVLEVIDACRQATGHDRAYSVGSRRAGDPPQLVAAADLAQRKLGWRPSQSDIGSIVSSAWRWRRAHPRGF